MYQQGKPALANPIGVETSGAPANLQRRTLIGGALAAFLASRRPAGAQPSPVHDPFILLLKGIYQPVAPGTGPASNLGLTTVNLNDGSYWVTRIYPVFGISDDPNVPIGSFYVQLTGSLCAYDLPGGSIAMQFLSGSGAAIQMKFGNVAIVPDGAGGDYLKAIFDLTILEARGLYSPFAAGHNHMVASTHELADGSLDEFCFCHISGKGQ